MYMYIVLLPESWLLAAIAHLFSVSLVPSSQLCNKFRICDWTPWIQ